MKKSLVPVIAGAAVIAALAAMPASAQKAPPTPTPKPVAASIVAPAADRLLKEVGTFAGSAEAFIFHADITFDQVLPSGQKLQFAAAEDVVLQRPDHLYVEWNGDLGARQF